MFYELGNVMLNEGFEDLEIDDFFYNGIDICGDFLVGRFDVV